MEFYSFSIFMGFLAGIVPGSLFILLVSETLTHGLYAGVRVSFAPVVSDLFVVIASVVAVSMASDITGLIPIVSVIGCAYISYLGYGLLKYRPETVQSIKRLSVFQLLTVNFFNPKVYLFWIAIGAPFMVDHTDSVVDYVLFVVVFYTVVVIVKLGIVFVVMKVRNLLTGKLYLYTMRILGCSLFVIAILFLKHTIGGP